MAEKELSEKQKETVVKTTENDGKFKKGNKVGKQFTSTYQPKDRKLKNAVKKLFKEVCLNELENLQEYATLKMSEWVKQKLDDVETLTPQELEKIQKYLEFLRDSSGQKPTDKQEITNIIPEIKVASKEDLQTLEKLKNVDFNKGIQ